MSSKNTRGLSSGAWNLPRVLFLSLLGLGVVGSSARGDIIDQDVEEEAPPAKAAAKPAPGAVAPAASKEATGRAKSEPSIETTSDTDARSGLKEPTAHAKNAAPTSNTSVIPPKNPGKPLKGKNAKGKTDAQEPVRFKSDGLNGLREKGMVELLHDVEVTQGELKLESDRAQVLFDEASHEVRKVIAEGHVRINGIDENSGDQFKAFGDRAVFLNSERTVVLDGNAKLLRGEDSVIRSRKITYEMNTGWIRADRVAGEVQAEAKDGKPSKAEGPEKKEPPAKTKATTTKSPGGPKASATPPPVGAGGAKP